MGQEFTNFKPRAARYIGNAVGDSMGAGAEGGEREDSVVVVVRVQYTYRRCSVDPDGGRDKEDEKRAKRS